MSLCEAHSTAPALGCTQCIVEQMDHVDGDMHRACVDLEAAMWLLEQAQRRLERLARGEP